MTLRVVKHYLPGMPQTPRGARARQKAKAAHTTEGNPGEKGAWDTISWMHATAAIRNASYNEFWAADEAKRELLAIEVVPDTSAAHSIAPQPFNAEGLPLYQPDGQVRAVLGTTVSDPNMWVYAITIAGRVADANRYAQMGWFVNDARQRLDQLTKRGIGSPVLEHFRFNPRTRSDWGQHLTEALSKGASDMQFWNPVLQDYWTKPGARFWDGSGNAKTFTSRIRVTSIASSATGHKLLKFGNELLVALTGDLEFINGTRRPTAGYGFIEPEPKEVVREVIKEVPVPDPKAVEDAVAAEKERIRRVLDV